jgi:hypothetical protein
VDRWVAGSGAAGGDEEAALLRARASPVSDLAVFVQRVDGAGVQQHLSGFAELRIADRQQPVGRVVVLAVQADRLPDPQSGARQQSDQRLERRRAQPRAQRAGGRHQRGDLLVSVDVWGGPVLARWEQLERQDLAGRIERVQIAREGPDRPQPPRQVVRTAARWAPRPFQCELRGDRALPRLLSERDELREQPRLADELEPERPADRQMVLGVFSERAHVALPGHGMTT